MQIRPAQAADLDHLARLWHEGWHDAHAALVPPGLAAARTPLSFRGRLAAALADTFVIGPAGAPLGFFMLRGEELWQFYVARSARGTRVAATLMAQAEAELLRRGVARPWLDCAVGNNRAARFYEKSGWSRTHTEVKRIETAEGVFEATVWIYQKAFASGNARLEPSA